MNIFKMFNTGKAVDDVLDKDNGHLTKIGEWIDNRSFSEEEAQKLNMEVGSAVRDYAVATLNESTDRSKTRRNIAEFWMKFYGLMVFTCGMTYPIDKEWSAMWYSLATSATITGLVVSISIFFYGSHALQRFKTNS